MSAPIAPVPDPDLRSVLQALKVELLAQLNCHQWGTVVSFDSAKQTAVVQLAVLRQVPDPEAPQPQFVIKPYPMLLDVPVMILTGGTGALTFPIAAGDVCLVLFNDRDMDNFWETGTVSIPNTPRLHDLSDGLAIIGFRTKASPIASYDGGRVKLLLGGTYLALGTKVELKNGSSSLKLLTQKLIDMGTALDAKTGPSAAAAIAAAQTAADNLLQ